MKKSLKMKKRPNQINKPTPEDIREVSPEEELASLMRSGMFDKISRSQRKRLAARLERKFDKIVAKARKNRGNDIDEVDKWYDEREEAIEAQMKEEIDQAWSVLLEEGRETVVRYRAEGLPKESLDAELDRLEGKYHEKRMKSFDKRDSKTEQLDHQYEQTAVKIELDFDKVMYPNIRFRRYFYTKLSASRPIRKDIRLPPIPETGEYLLWDHLPCLVDKMNTVLWTWCAYSLNQWLRILESSPVSTRYR